MTTKKLKKASAPKTFLQEGSAAPEFSAMTQDDKMVGLKDFPNQRVVIFFYPKDDTPGCTKEACGLRDLYSEIQKTGVQLLGVSPDPVKSHKKFAEKFNLPFPLLADEDKTIVQAYGVWGEKSFMGRKYMGVHRTTFLIETDGKIKKIWEQVKPDQHAAEILAALQNS
jgi:thioredoxin-dependent peroxiredoxin